MQTEQFMTREKKSYNYSCKVAKNVREKRLATVPSEGSLVVFLARLYHALIESTAKLLCD